MKIIENNKKTDILVYLGLGASEGAQEEKEKIILESCKIIKTWGTLFEVSAFFYSKPWGGVAKNDFINAVCSLKTSFSAEKLLNKIHELELSFGRKRDIHWGDRTLDIDILLYGTKKIDTDILTIPHKYMWERNFVYEPLKELMGNNKYKEYKKLYRKF